MSEKMETKQRARTATVGGPGTQQPLVPGQEQVRGRGQQAFLRLAGDGAAGRLPGATDQVKAGKADGLGTPSREQKERGNG